MKITAKNSKKAKEENKKTRQKERKHFFYTRVKMKSPGERVNSRKTENV